MPAFSAAPMASGVFKSRSRMAAVNVFNPTPKQAHAVYGIAPPIKRRLTGQIAGITGAYGNVGSVAFLTVLSFLPARNIQGFNCW